MAAILDAILKIIAFPIWDFGVLLVCYQILPKSVKKKLLYKWILKDLWPSTGSGGHLGRHFENNSFSDVGFWRTFSMLFMISNTTQISWKTFCIMNFKRFKPSTGYGGHLGRHFENNTFPDVGLWGTLSMLYMILNTTQISWKTFCMMNFERFITIYRLYGGHLGRHFENISFPDVGFWGTFSMLLMISYTTQIRWKNLCSNLLGVKL